MSVKVAVRVRPFNQRETFLGCYCCVDMNERTTTIYEEKSRTKKQHSFTFDHCFWSHDGFGIQSNGLLVSESPRYVGQQGICDTIGTEIVNNCWQGYNCCLFAYGQTGAGKSYTMLGQGANRGIIPYIAEQLFALIKKMFIKSKKEYEVSLSMLEIYNEKVQDLFVVTSKRPSTGLKIRENKQLGVYVENLIKHPIQSYVQLQSKMEIGSKNRSLASTLMNEYSSRAHTIISIELIQKSFGGKMSRMSSVINLVDLAGSERIDKTGISANKDRLKEASNINKSLHTLGRVIESLAEKKNIPYRDSALTRILQSALGGNSKTTMICTLSPASDNYEQTLATLRYADQCKRVKNKPVVNDNSLQQVLGQLKQENQRLKLLLQRGEGEEVRASIQQVQKEIKKNMQSFSIRNQGEDELLLEDYVEVQEQIEKDDEVYLINLNEDAFLNMKVKYPIYDELLITCKQTKQKAVVLNALGIEQNHAIISVVDANKNNYQMSRKQKDNKYSPFKHNQNREYEIRACSETASEYTLINGRAVNRRQLLRHQDRIIFGTNSVFLFINLRQSTNIDPRMNYLFAITQRQEAMEDVSVLGKRDNEVELLKKLEDIQKQYAEKMAQNQKKNKEKQDMYRQALKNTKPNINLQNNQAVQRKLYSSYQEESLLKPNRKLQTKNEIKPEWLFAHLPQESYKNIQLKNESIKSSYSQQMLLQKNILRLCSVFNIAIPIYKSRIFTICKQYQCTLFQEKSNEINKTMSSTVTEEELFMYIQGKDVLMHKKEEAKVAIAINNKEQSTQTEFFFYQIHHQHHQDPKLNHHQNQYPSQAEMSLEYSKIQNNQAEQMSMLNFDTLYKEREGKKNNYLNQDDKIIKVIETQDNDIKQNNTLIFEIEKYQQNENHKSQSQKKQFQKNEIQNKNKHQQSKKQQQNILDQKLQKQINKQKQQTKQQQQMKQKLKINQGDKIKQKVQNDQFQQRQLKNKFHRELQMKLIECNNENILTERNLLSNRRKKESQQLRKLLLKKQKISLMQRLLPLIPMVRRFNLIAKELKRRIDIRIELQYHNYSHFEMAEMLRNPKYSNGIAIYFVVYNFQHKRLYRWNQRTFTNRFQIVEQLYEKDSLIEQEQSKDPFWDPPQFISCGVGYLSLESLLYGIPIVHKIIFVSHSSVVGYINIKINYPKPAFKSIQTEAAKQIQEISIPNQKSLLGNKLFFTVEINTLQCEKNGRYYISYDLLQDDYKAVTYNTQELQVENGTLSLHYHRTHCLQEVSSRMLLHLTDCPLKFTLHLLHQENTFQHEDITSQIFDQSSISVTSVSNIVQIQDQFSSKNHNQSNENYIQNDKKFVKKKCFFQNDQFNQKIDQQLKKIDKNKKVVKNNKQSKHKQCLIY